MLEVLMAAIAWIIMGYIFSALYTLIKITNTQRKVEELYYAIARYQKIQVSKGQKIEVDVHDIKSISRIYVDACLKFWVLGYKGMISKEKLEIIKPYIVKMEG